MASYRLKRKTFAVLGIGNVAKNWNIASRAASMGKYGAMAKAGAKSLGTSALYAAPVVGLGVGTVQGAKGLSDTLTGEIGTDY